MYKNTCCFIGHRRVENTEAVQKKLNEIIEGLIINNNVNVFLFGSKSRFDDLCYDAVTALKSKYPHIKRIYVRAEFPYINGDYEGHLLKFYEDTYYSEKIINSGKAVYIERNCEMIDKSKYCVTYYDKSYLPPKGKQSGTRLAYDYAVRKKKRIINVY